MQSVTVLTTHGRRQVVKVEPNKTVLWILEQVCTKFDFDASVYGLKHHNKLLDLSQMFRFAGLPNNCQLEMVEVEQKRDSDQSLLVCVQLESGSRINGNFPPTANLREIITSLCPEEAAESPVVIYMRTEVFGDELDTKTLKALGLSSGGRALLRLINKDPASLRTQANVSKALPQKPREEQVDRPRQFKHDVPAVAQLVKELKTKKDIQSEPMDLRVEEVESEPMEVEAPVVENSPSVDEIAPSASESSSASQAQQIEYEEPVLNFLDDRGTVIFSLDALKASTMELPDSFFDLTESEIRKLYRDLKSDVDNLDNKPLMTKELRKLDENKKILNQLSIYKTTALRILFPNRFVIQSKFSTVETLEVVMDFVRKFLIIPELDFHLYLTPPKQILEKNVTLIELNLVPSALLHFGCEIPLDDYLKPELYEKLSTGMGVSQALRGNQNLHQNITEEAAGGSNANSSRKPVPTNFLPSKATQNEATGAVPKWFKKGK